MGFGPTKGRSCPGRLRTGLPARVFGSEAVLECVSPADGRGKNTAASPASATARVSSPSPGAGGRVRGLELLFPGYSFCLLRGTF